MDVKFEEIYFKKQEKLTPISLKNRVWIQLTTIIINKIKVGLEVPVV